MVGILPGHSACNLAVREDDLKTHESLQVLKGTKDAKMIIASGSML